MPSTRLHKFFIANLEKTSKTALIFWWTFSFTIAIAYSLLALKTAFSAEFVVQDDARQHIFWMQRFFDPQLFPQDLIADYFQSVAPAGYAAFYQAMAMLGIPPILLHKLLPVGLGLVTTGYCFAVSLQLFPVPAAAFLTTFLLNQSLWMQDGVISATPKAFVYPLFMVFLYYFLRRSWLGTGAAIALFGLFYPQAIFIAAGLLILQLINFKNKKIQLIKNRSDYGFCAVGLIISFLVLLPYALSSSAFDPVISVAEAKNLPDFFPGGRSRFFNDDPWSFWLHGRSGIGLSGALTPPLMVAGFFLPFLLRSHRSFPLGSQVTQKIWVLPQLLIASGVMFFAAHLFLFQLHLPSRYTQHTLRIAIAFAAGIALTLLLDAVLKKLIQPQTKTIVKILGFLTVTCISFVTLFYPQLTMKNFPWTYYVVGTEAPLYQFFQQQPKDSLIASLVEEANNLPTFAQRSIFVGREYAIPYHLGYYQKFRDRTLDLIQAQYSPNLAEVQQFIQKYSIDFWLIEEGALTADYIRANRWMQQYQPAAGKAIAELQTRTIPALATISDRCSIFQHNHLIVLDANCIIQGQK